jgi:hypothetical protein
MKQSEQEKAERQRKLDAVLRLLATMDMTIGIREPNGEFHEVTIPGRREEPGSDK